MTTDPIQQAVPAAEPEGYITKAQLAKRLKKAPRTVEYWQKKGIIPYVKIGQSVLFNWAEVEQRLQTHFRICHGECLRTAAKQ